MVQGPVLVYDVNFRIWWSFDERMKWPETILECEVGPLKWEVGLKRGFPFLKYPTL